MRSRTLEIQSLIIGGYRKWRSRWAAAFLALAVLCGLVTAGAVPQNPNGPGHKVSILVTAHPHNERLRAIADKLAPRDFVVREDKRRQRILSVKPAGELPPILSVLIQDDLESVRKLTFGS